MFTGILSLLNGLFNTLSSFLASASKKDTENQIRNVYEEEKRADNLEEDKIAAEKISEANDKVKDTKEDVKAVRDTNIVDAELSKDEVKTELDNIEDEDDRRVREKEIAAAVKLKERKSLTKEKILNNDDFNDGKEITFEG